MLTFCAFLSSCLRFLDMRTIDFGHVNSVRVQSSSDVRVHLYKVCTVSRQLHFTSSEVGLLVGVGN